ncbi:MAG: hypothetical protein QXP57_02110 [Nitrososphaerota archaeon]
MVKNVVLPAGLSPKPDKRTSPLGLEGSLLLGTLRSPAWEKTSSIVSRAEEYEDEFEEDFEDEEWEEYEEGFEEYDEFDDFAEYLDNRRW